MKNIAVIGGGAGGLIFANTVAKEMSDEIKSGKLKIRIFDGSVYHEFQPGYLGVAFRGRNPASIRRYVSTLVLPGIDLIPENCSKVDIDNRFVITEKTSRKFEFDEVVIATGSRPDYSQISGLSEVNHDFHSSAKASSNTYDRLQKIKWGRVVTGIAGVPYKCPPSPNEAAFMLDEFFVKRKLRSDVKITFITPFLRGYSNETVNSVIEPLYKERNVEIITGFNLESVDAEKELLVSMEGDKVPFDTLMLVPPHTGAQVFKGEEYADSDGWVKTDKYDLHVTDHDYAFAIGDATSLPISKAGVEAHLEAIVVAKNMMSEMKGSSEKYEFTGRLQCSMETGFHQATFVIGTYEKPIERIQPSFYNYMQKKLMERIYWSSLKGGYEWLFKWHFGEDYYRKTSREKPPTQTPKVQGV